MAQTENPSKLTVSGYFLYLVSDAFFKELTQLPELEFARDKIKVAPSQECVDQTIYCVLYQFDNAAYDREQATALGILPIKVTVDSVSDYYTADASTEQAWGTTLPTVEPNN